MEDYAINSGRFLRLKRSYSIDFIGLALKNKT